MRLCHIRHIYVILTTALYTVSPKKQMTLKLVKTEIFIIQNFNEYYVLHSPRGVVYNAHIVRTATRTAISSFTFVLMFSTNKLKTFFMYDPFQFGKQNEVKRSNLTNKRNTTA